MTERTKDDIKEDLRIAWEAWEERPANVAAALDMEDVCQEAAEALGMTGTDFRIYITSLRRAGLPIEKALTNAFSVRIQ